MPAVSDSSPLILLAAIGRLDLLHRLYGEVAVPPAVWQEVVEIGRGRAGAAAISRLGWIRRRALPTDDVPPFLARLRRGEAEAIALADALPRDTAILLDDLPARRVAAGLGMSVTGTAGVLVLAKQEDLIVEVRPLLIDLRAAGLYLSNVAVDQLLDLAGERSKGSRPRSRDAHRLDIVKTSTWPTVPTPPAGSTSRSGPSSGVPAQRSPEGAGPPIPLCAPRDFATLRRPADGGGDGAVAGRRQRHGARA